MVGFSRYFLFQSFGAGKGKDSDKNLIECSRERDYKGSFGVVRERKRDNRDREGPRPELTVWEQSGESGLQGTSRPAQPVEQVDRSEPKCEYRGRAFGGCTRTRTDRCGCRVPSPAHPLLSLTPTVFPCSQWGFAGRARELPEIRKRSRRVWEANE